MPMLVQGGPMTMLTSTPSPEVISIAFGSIMKSLLITLEVEIIC